MLSKLQYISQGATPEIQLHNIRRALSAGCDWIQLRCKNMSSQKVWELALTAKSLCEAYSAILIINDDVALAQLVHADGVHLGLTDMSISEARKILGAHKIIGGTANTTTDMLQRMAENCDYIGLGPYRFTNTKELLSPVLGIAGYTSMMTQISCPIPVYAIGGILQQDVEPLLETGIHGIAISGLITDHENPKTLVTQLNNLLYVNT